MVKLMCQRQAISTLKANKTYHPKAKTTLKKRNVVPLTKPDRSKLVKPRKINVQKPTFPAATGNPLNWKSTTGKSLTQEAIDTAHGMSTNLVPMKGSQLMNTPSTPSSTSPVAPTEITEHSKYCAICTPLGRDCPEKFAVSSDWDEEDNNKEKDQKHNPKAALNSSKCQLKLCYHQNHI